MKRFQRAVIPGAERLPETLRDDAVFVNDIYQVNLRVLVCDNIGRIIHLSIKRRDKEAIHDWRDLQWIKNQIVGPEVEAVEIYPAESQLVDTSNQYHLWCLLDGNLPFGLNSGRVVSEKSGEELFPGQKNKQRRFADHCRPHDLAAQEAKLDQAWANVKATMSAPGK